jgi:1,4-alpha-glucan branching enzyme
MSGDRLRRGVWDSAYEYYGAHPCDGGWVFRVWAPQARCVALSGDFNEWQRWDMRRLEDGTWELTVENARQFDGYQYVVTQGDGREVWKSDPYGFHQETRPSTNSKLYDIGGYTWHDEKWRQRREDTHPAEGCVNIYEVHLGSWRRTEDGQVLNYRDMADQLALYVRDMGYNYVELLPVTEYPLDDSWGYQCVGYFAPTSRYGTPHDFMYLVDRLHRAGIGVILDWVPAHFCKDSHGLIQFDGSCLYEYSDPLKWEHESWGTRVFDFGKPEVCSFLLSSAAYWLREYHIDGLRVDAVASMLYLDYDRQQWRPNQHGGKENLEAIEFLRQLNRTAFAIDGAALMVAEESTAWPMVTYPPEEGGLGFNLKWNMGWMNDVCHYLKMDPFFRQHHHRDVTFSMVYAFSENFVLPVSHDEVVHMKGSLRGKMPGDKWQQLAGVRGFYAYMLCHPGKVLTFMGTELAQWHEWDFRKALDWYLLDEEDDCRQTHECIRALNRFYKSHKALWENDRDWDGFQWLVADDNYNNVLVFRRTDRSGKSLVAVINFSPVAVEGYRFGVPPKARYEELFNTDEERWGGSGVTNPQPIKTECIPSHQQAQSIAVRVPPLGAVILQGKGKLIKPLDGRE